MKLLAIPTYRAGVVGGFLFRTGLGAGPFLLPLLFQMGFGMTAFQSGMMTFATGAGAMFMKTQVASILRRYGFRRVLMINALVSGLFAALPALFTAATPTLLITVLFLAGGLVALAAVHQHQYARLRRHTAGAPQPRDELCRRLPGAVGLRRRDDCGAGSRSRAADARWRSGRRRPFPAGVPFDRRRLGVIDTFVYATFEVRRRFAARRPRR